MAMADLAISIVAHPSGDLSTHAAYLEQCIASLRETVSGQTFRLVVTNNLGAVDLFSHVPSLTGEETLIVNEQPQGFAANHNRVVREATEPFVLLLNDDTVVLEGAVGLLLDTMQALDRVGMAGPRIYTDASKREQQPSAGVRVMSPERALLWRLLRETPLIGMQRLRRCYSELDCDAPPGDVLHLQGACLMACREAYLQSGGMDEEYHMYREETDLCLAIRRRGWRVVYCPEAEILHFGGASTAGARYREQYQTSLDRFLRKHYGWRATVVNGLIQPPLLGALRLLRRMARWRRPADHVSMV